MFCSRMMASMALFTWNATRHQRKAKDASTRRLDASGHVEINTATYGILGRRVEGRGGCEAVSAELETSQSDVALTLIEKQDGRSFHQSPGDRYPLLLSAGQTRLADC
jgi:hypothetical protein